MRGRGEADRQGRGAEEEVVVELVDEGRSSMADGWEMPEIEMELTPLLPTTGARPVAVHERRDSILRWLQFGRDNQCSVWSGVPAVPQASVGVAGVELCQEWGGDAQR